MCPVTCFCHSREGSGLTPARAHSVYLFSVLRALGGIELRIQHRVAWDKMASPSWVCRCVRLGPRRARCGDTLAQSSPGPFDSLGAFGAVPRPSLVPTLLCVSCKPTSPHFTHSVLLCSLLSPGHELEATGPRLLWPPRSRRSR